MAPPRCRNILRELFKREVTGKRPSLTCVPSKHIFRLCHLVDANTLMEGHVFLGFTKNGQFLVSYTITEEFSYSVAQVVYFYTLHWWRFVPFQSLKKVSEVKLFRDHNIYIPQALFIVFCEWPFDDSQVVVYGTCHVPTASSQTQPCCITITAMPPVNPCPLCMLSTKDPCLRHCFAIHARYYLLPPFPSLPLRVVLKRDGCIVVNMGYSLASLSVSTTSSQKVDTPTSQPDSRYTTCSVWHFHDSAVSEQDTELDLESLTLDVRGRNDVPLQPCPKSTIPEPNGIRIELLTFDLDQCMDEMAQNLCTIVGKQYYALNDYDARIVDVCMETGNVRAKAKIQIMAIDHDTGCKRLRNGDCVQHNSVRHLYSTTVVFEWIVKTGVYKVIESEDFQDITTLNDAHDNSLQFTMDCQLLRRKYTMPNQFFTSIHILDNDAVFCGTSKPILLHPRDYVAIVL